VSPVEGDERTRVQDLFQRALELEPGARASFVERACTSEPALRAELDSLIAAFEREPGFLERTGWRLAPRDAAVLGTRLGSWELVGVLGAGGMGTVFRARRVDGEYRGEAAIKVVRVEDLAAARTEQADLHRRFREERQILADLDHPWIARLLDAGTGNDGSPYLVMECVEGTPIDRYCEERALGVSARLALFHKVCRAVQYAHAKFVAHGDLKPSNVLVADADGEPAPKLLDFGVARLFGPRGAEATAATVGVRRLTPAWASPEQIRGEPVTAATDVYSLGLVLYRLLCGKHPYELASLELPAMAHAICEREPTRPSAIDRRLSGDLETIVLKALAKEPERRFASAAAFGDDLARFLEGRPILARPQSRPYVLRKALSRNRLASAIGAALVLTLVGGSAWLALVYVRALRSEGLEREARRGADARREQAERTARLFVEVFATPDPFLGSGRDTTVAAALDRGVPRLLEGLAGEPEALAAIRGMIGSTYHGLGEYEKAELHLRAAVEDLAARRGPQDAEALAAMGSLAGLLLDRSRLNEAEQLYRELAERLPRTHGERDPRTLRVRRFLALCLRERGAPYEAERIARDVLAVERELGSAGAAQTASALALILENQGRFAEAEVLAREAAGALAAELGPTHPEVLELECRHARTLWLLGRGAEAEERLTRVLEEMRRALGERHKVTLSTIHELARLAQARGATGEAERLFLDVIEKQESTLGPGHPDTLAAMSDLSSLYLTGGRPDEAEQLLRSALAAQELSLGHDHQYALTLRFNLGYLLQRRGRLAEARAELAAVVDRAQAAYPDHPITANAQLVYGQVLAALGEREAAREPLANALKAWERLRGPDDPKAREAAQALAAIAEQGGGR